MKINRLLGVVVVGLLILLPAVGCQALRKPNVRKIIRTEGTGGCLKN